jgi:hypothetical protein
MNELSVGQGITGKRLPNAPPEHAERQIRHDLLDAFAAAGLELLAGIKTAEEVLKEHTERLREVALTSRNSYGVAATNAALKSYGLEKFIR